MRRWTLPNALTGILYVILQVGLPLVGVALTGGHYRRYTEFPPLTRYVEHAGFSPVAFIALLILILAVCGPFVFRMLTAAPVRDPGPVGRFPWFGWFGLAMGAGWWILAWNRFVWFAWFQAFTFSPLWFSYILVVNGLVKRRTGRCMLSHQPGRFASLFILSAAFWWFFEYLNRFVQNWYYVDILQLTSLEYFIFATLPFSTVLPAVLGTYELLRSYPRLTSGLDPFLPLSLPLPRSISAAMLLLSCAALAAIGIWPDALYPMLWVAPLLILTSLQALRGRPTVFSRVRRGDWRRVVLLAMSALICGFFWEMWNFHSLARWIYAVPYVGRFHLFEMPVLGYAGYLPFGLECAILARLAGPVDGDDKLDEPGPGHATSCGTGQAHGLPGTVGRGNHAAAAPGGCHGLK